MENKTPAVTEHKDSIICHCGKTGCMETETSGSALLRKMNQKLQEGGTSVLTDKVMKQHQELTLQDILDAIQKEDVLSIESLQRMAVELGTNLASAVSSRPSVSFAEIFTGTDRRYLERPRRFLQAEKICLTVIRFPSNP